MYLLTGGAGTLGTELQKYLKCFAPSRSQLNVKWSENKLSNALNDKMKDIKCIIHAAAYTNVPGAEINRKEAVEINVIGSRNIKELANIYQIPVVYISSDYAYEGTVGGYKETDKLFSFNFYGFTKNSGEVFFDNQDLVIRTSFKPNDLWEKRYNKAFIDIYSSADYVDIVAPEIAFAIHSKLKGIYNIATERKSIYELAVKRYPNVGEMSRWDVSEWIKMPSDISMNIDKYLEFKNNHIKEFEEFVK